MKNVFSVSRVFLLLPSLFKILRNSFFPAAERSEEKKRKFRVYYILIHPED